MCRGTLAFDFVSSITLPRGTQPVSDEDLATALLRSCGLRLPAAWDGEGQQGSSEAAADDPAARVEQMMGLRILSPDLAVTAAQVLCNCNGSVWCLSGACLVPERHCSSGAA